MVVTLLFSDYSRAIIVNYNSSDRDGNKKKTAGSVSAEEIRQFRRILICGLARDSDWERR
jgi:hypothetical protein